MTFCKKTGLIDIDALKANMPKGLVMASSHPKRGNAELHQAYLEAGAAEAHNILDELGQAFREFRQSYDARLTDLQASIDSRAQKDAAMEINGGSRLVRDPAYCQAFQSYMRGGEVQASLKKAPDADGGYLAPIEWDRQVHEEMLPLSPIRAISQVQSIATAGFSTLWRNEGPATGWVGETAARPETNTPTFGSVVFTTGELYANPAASTQMLEDAQIDLGAWLTSQVRDTFAIQENLAFVGGDGVNKPRGFLGYVTGGSSAGHHPGGNLQVVNTGQASTLGATDQAIVDKLVDFAYGLPSPYRVGAHWVMNSLTAARLAKLRDAENNLIWRESLSAGQPSTLLGRPVTICEDMPNVAANALPIAFGNFQRGYLIVDRLGMTVLRDPYSNKPFTHFYARRRVGGGVLDPKAIRLLKVAA